MKKILIKTNSVVKEATLDDSETASAIWEALPIEGAVNRWGDEIYFDIPINVGPAPDARAEMEVGAIAYWPPGTAFCIFWGPTPASQGSEPCAASPVNVFGRVEDDPEDFGSVRDGETILIERINL
ncbi:cyclophilin-like fold protein [Planctomycetota bacterium]